VPHRGAGDLALPQSPAEAFASETRYCAVTPARPAVRRRLAARSVVAV